MSAWFTVRKHSERPGVWCCIEVPDGRIISTHATRDGAAISANQLNRAEAQTDDPPGVWTVTP